MSEPVVTILPSGYTLLRWSRECLAQIPPGFAEDEIPDEMMTAPEWNRHRINRWWREHGTGKREGVRAGAAATGGEKEDA